MTFLGKVILAVILSYAYYTPGLGSHSIAQRSAAVHCNVIIINNRYKEYELHNVVEAWKIDERIVFAKSAQHVKLNLQEESVPSTGSSEPQVEAQQTLASNSMQKIANQI